MITLEEEEQKNQIRWPDSVALLTLVLFSKIRMGLGHQVSLDIRASAQTLAITNVGLNLSSSSG